VKIIDAEVVNTALSFPLLIKELEAGFRQDFSMPKRQVLSLANDPNLNDGLALLPAWNDAVIGVKVFTHFPGNAQQNLPTLFSKILLFDRSTGTPLALVDGTSVTYWRTAAISALASRYLARADASRLCLLGTGRLAIPLVTAHLSAHALSVVTIWGRNESKASAIVTQLRAKFPAVSFSAVREIEEGVATADIIVSATGSAEPLVCGDQVPAGCHVDLLGNHHVDRRECDSQLVTKSLVYVDDRANVLSEAGELLIPIAEGSFKATSIQGELKQLCRGDIHGRQTDTAITLFKSVGTALSDLITAHMVYQFSS
jgi:1-pyrroline-2-carboxylate reductase [NAD(P)H]